MKPDVILMTRKEALERAFLLYGHSTQSIFSFAEQIYNYANKGIIPPEKSTGDNSGETSNAIL